MKETETLGHRIGEALKEQREAQGLTKVDVAKQTGFNP